jgi:hypothetical protein
MLSFIQSHKMQFQDKTQNLISVNIEKTKIYNKLQY